MKAIQQRLLDGPPWVRYRALVDLQGVDPGDAVAMEAREAMEKAPELAPLLADVGRWPGTVLSNHRSAQQGFHILSFLSELGVSPGHPAIAFALGRILDSMGADGLPRLPMTYPEHFGGTGKETMCWALCDAPVTLKAVVKLGLGKEPKVARGVETILAMVKPFGWPCVVAPELGSFRGPGKKADPCPYATLVSLELMASCLESAQRRADGSPPAWRTLDTHPAVAYGIEALLSAFDRSVEVHPYMFYAGTDFRKLKAPCLWYDALHVADTLSRFPLARTDKRFVAMVDAIRSKAGTDGSFMAESVYQAYKAWDFGQKKTPSPWIEFMATRIERRIALG